MNTAQEFAELLTSINPAITVESLIQYQGNWIADILSGKPSPYELVQRSRAILENLGHIGPEGVGNLGIQRNTAFRAVSDLQGFHSGGHWPAARDSALEKIGKEISLVRQNNDEAISLAREAEEFVSVAEANVKQANSVDHIRNMLWGHEHAGGQRLGPRPGQGAEVPGTAPRVRAPREGAGGVPDTSSAGAAETPGCVPSSGRCSVTRAVPLAPATRPTRPARCSTPTVSCVLKWRRRSTAVLAVAREQFRDNLDRLSLGSSRVVKEITGVDPMEFPTVELLTRKLEEVGYDLSDMEALRAATRTHQRVAEPGGLRLVQAVEETLSVLKQSEIGGKNFFTLACYTRADTHGDEAGPRAHQGLRRRG